MRRYIMEWDPEKRQVPLQKIMDIFHELGQEEVKCYVLIKPQHKNVIEELKTREGLTFYWEEDLGLRGSIFYSHELMPAWIGVFSIDELDSVEEFDEILFWDDYYPVGTVVLSKNIMLPYDIRNLYAEVLDGTLRAEFFHAIMLFEGVFLLMMSLLIVIILSLMRDMGQMSFSLNGRNYFKGQIYLTGQK